MFTLMRVELTIRDPRMMESRITESITLTFVRISFAMASPS